LVADAAEELGEVLRLLEFREPQRGRFFSTTEVRYPERSEIEQVLLAQLTSPVRFTQSLRAVLPGAKRGIEVGPGNVLAGLVKRLDKSFEVRGTSDEAALAALTAGGCE
jgi:[acyl-carrier-protein] S-malonyltransferase